MSMDGSDLAALLIGIPWVENIKQHAADMALMQSFVDGNYRIAIWARQLETIERGQPALSFIRETQLAGQLVPTLTSLALYKPAAAAMRAMLETALYFTYFRVHERELDTLEREPKYYVSKHEIVEWHKLHTPGFATKQEALGLRSRLDEWYKTMSVIVHGQSPGRWVVGSGIRGLKASLDVAGQVSQEFTNGVKIVNDLLLCTVAAEEWDGFGVNARRQLLKGVSAANMGVLGLERP